MKRSRIVILTLAGVSLGLTGCRRPPAIRGILPPDQLPPAFRASLPIGYVPGSDVSAAEPPHNAYDPRLGYYHEPCRAWFPYPYNHHDSRWGYYRCGRWSRSSRVWSRPIGSSRFVNPPVEDLYSPQPPGAPQHAGVAHADATRTLSGSTHRGGFGGTGRSFGFRSLS
jgi:hypothetical protein